MNAHQLDANGVVINTIVVDSLSFLPGLVDAELGGKIGDRWDGLHFIPSAGPAIADLVTAFEHLADSETDAIYAAAIGNRGPEYEDAAREAAEFKAAGYPDDAIPDTVSSWAIPKQKSAQWAADDILASAAALTVAKKAIRAKRLAAKEGARAALGGDDQAPIDTAASQWAAFVVAIRAQLKV